MPRLTQKMRVDPDRARYYKARADRIERQNAELDGNLIATKQIRSGLRRLCLAIAAKIRKSCLEPDLEGELFAELRDLPERLSLNSEKGKAKTRSTRRGQKRNAHQTNEEC